MGSLSNHGVAVVPTGNGATIRSGGHAAPRVALGLRLRQQREAAGLSRGKAGYEIRASEAKICRMELGRVRCRIRDVEDLLTLYGTDEATRRAILTLADQAGAPPWWHTYRDIVPTWLEPYLGLEHAAALIREFELQVVPGLLQTPTYADAVCRFAYSDQDELARRVALRVQRQERLRQPDAPVLQAVVDEAVLQRPIGGRATMRAQLLHLMDAIELPTVHLRILPTRSGGHPAAGGAFTALRFAEPELADVVYLEQLTSATYLDRPADLTCYDRVFSQLWSTRAEPVTAELLHRALDSI